MKKGILFLVSLLLLSRLPVQACEPCAKILNFEETVRNADLIIEGSKSADGPLLETLENLLKTDWNDISVHSVLKGDESNESIRINSWEGMCEYGIVVDDGHFIMFLKERNVEYENYQYDAVNFGCSVKKYPVKDDMVLLEEETISMNAFKNKINEVLKKD